MKINICLDQIADNHLTLAAYTFADECQKSGIDVVFCVLNRSKSKFTKDYAFFEMADKYSNSGIYLCTSVNTASVVRNFCGKNLNLFYIWDLEWLESKDFRYESFIREYNIPNFQYATRSEDYKKTINKLWNIKDIEVVPDFDFAGVLQWIKKNYTEDM